MTTLLLLFPPTPVSCLRCCLSLPPQSAASLPFPCACLPLLSCLLCCPPAGAPGGCDLLSCLCRYLVLHHEVTVANLLEVALFHREACEAAGEDALLEVRDEGATPTLVWHGKEHRMWTQ
jgi:hypothetical protein